MILGMLLTCFFTLVATGFYQRAEYSWTIAYLSIAFMWAPTHIPCLI